jgi:hypothetical protein
VTTIQMSEVLAIVEELGRDVHSGLVLGHLIGWQWNRKKGNQWWALFHIAAAGVDAYAVLIHARDAARIRKAELMESVPQRRFTMPAVPPPVTHHRRA